MKISAAFSVHDGPGPSLVVALIPRGILSGMAAAVAENRRPGQEFPFSHPQSQPQSRRYIWKPQLNCSSPPAHDYTDVRDTFDLPRCVRLRLKLWTT